MKILSWQQACEEECTVILRIYIILMAERENQMKKFGLALIIFILLVFNGCGQISSFSGKYVNEQNKSEYLKFSGESTVDLYSDGRKTTGTYFIYNDAVMVTFGSGDNIESTIFAIKNKNTLIYNGVGVAYVKKTFWNYYWKKILLLIFIVYGALLVFNFVKNLKNGSNVGKAFNDALEQTEDMMDKMGE